MLPPMMLMLMLLPLMTLAAVQVPLPSSPPGFTIGKGCLNSSVQLDVFMDLLCPFSKDAFRGLKRLVHHLSPSDFRLRVHQFPLPYHQQAYSVAQASETIVFALGRDSFETWMDAVFVNQDSFGNKATELAGQAAVTDQLAQLAYDTFPNLTTAQWTDGMSGYGGTERDADTRVAWKYACSRGITGTPTFLLNDVVVDDPDLDWTLTDWLAYLQPYLQVGNRAKSSELLSSTGWFDWGVIVISVVGTMVVGIGMLFYKRRSLYNRI
ncbi:hypothetical protein DYB31_001956 [Aphanomyces astaci]|uniref:Uncharacterized protein n=1 Tax=Aphanomyces astaci TaxID=112090 RepID=A0A397F545_APHAT|nr:hypothetical protein DYB31_001956 [Aphanomyces astaci]